MIFTNNTTHRTAQTRSRSLLALGAFLALPALAVAQFPQMTFIGSNLPSEGRQWPHASSTGNGVLTQPYGGSSFQAGNLEVNGTAANVSYAGSSTHNHSGEMRILVRNLTKGTSYNSVNVFYNFNLPWSIDSTAGSGRWFDASSLGTIDPGDQIEVRLYETYDNSLSPDSRWNNITLELYRKPPTTSGYTAIDFAVCPCSPIGSGGSDDDVMLAIFDQTGDVIDSDDGIGSPDGAEVSLDGLPPGEYYVCVVSQGGSFDHGFEASVGGGTGTEGVVRLSREGSVFFEAWMHEDAALWHRLELVEQPCPADFDGDGLVGLSDLAQLLSMYGAACP